MGVVGGKGQTKNLKIAFRFHCRIPWEQTWSWLQAPGKLSMGRRVNTDQVSFLLTSISRSVSRSNSSCYERQCGYIYVLKKITVVKNQSKVSSNVFLRRKWHHSLGDSFQTLPFMAEGLWIGCWDIQIVTLNLWWLFNDSLALLVCLSGSRMRCSQCWAVLLCWQPCLDRDQRLTPQRRWHLLVLSLSLFLYVFLPSLFLHFSSLSAPSHTLCTWMVPSPPFASKNSLYYKCLLG